MRQKATSVLKTPSLVTEPPRWAFLCGKILPPQLFKPCRVGGGVADGVLNVAVPEVVLNEPNVCALVGAGKAAGMAQHVGMDGWAVPPPQSGKRPRGFAHAT